MNLNEDQKKKVLLLGTLLASTQYTGLKNDEVINGYDKEKMSKIVNSLDNKEMVKIAVKVANELYAELKELSE